MLHTNLKLKLFFFLLLIKLYNLKFDLNKQLILIKRLENKKKMY